MIASAKTAAAAISENSEAHSELREHENWRSRLEQRLARIWRRLGYSVELYDRFDHAIAEDRTGIAE